MLDLEDGCGTQMRCTMVERCTKLLGPSSRAILITVQRIVDIVNICVCVHKGSTSSEWKVLLGFLVGTTLLMAFTMSRLSGFRLPSRCSTCDGCGLGHCRTCVRRLGKGFVCVFCVLARVSIVSVRRVEGVFVDASWPPK